MTKQKRFPIQLELSHAELTDLVQIVFLGDYMKNKARAPQQEDSEACKKLYQAAHAAGFDGVTVDERRAPYPQVAPDLAPALADTLDDFKVQNTIEFIADEMATWDLMEKYGEAEWKKREPEMPTTEWIERYNNWIEWLDGRSAVTLQAIRLMRVSLETKQ